MSAAVDNVLARLDRVHRSGRGWTARCPAHDDHRPSLSINEGNDGRALVKCHAGCERTEIVAAMGLEMRDLFVENIYYSHKDNTKVTVASAINSNSAG